MSLKTHITDTKFVQIGVIMKNNVLKDVILSRVQTDHSYMIVLHLHKLEISLHVTYKLFTWPHAKQHFSSK